MPSYRAVPRKASVTDLRSQPDASAADSATVKRGDVTITADDPAAELPPAEEASKAPAKSGASVKVRKASPKRRKS